MRAKIKDFIKSPYGLIILISWIALIICLIVKLFGGNWFELWLENDNFIKFCEFVDNIQWLKMVLSAILYLVSGYFSLCIILKCKFLSKKHLLVFYPIMIAKTICTWYFPTLAFILDIFILLVLTTIFNKKPLRNIICFVIIFLFQFITIGVRNLLFWLGGFNFGNSFIEQFLIQIDYYLMIGLFYLYTIKKVKEVN